MLYVKSLLSVFVLLSISSLYAQSIDPSLDYRKAKGAYDVKNKDYLDYKKQYDSQVSNLNQLKAKRKQLLDEKSILEDRIGKDRGQIQNLKFQNDQSRREISNLETEKRNVQNQLNTVNSNIRNTDRQIQNLNSELARLRAQAEPWKQQERDKQNQINQKDREIRNVSNDLVTKNRQKQDIINAINNKNQERANLDNETIRNQNKIAENMQTIDDKSNQIAVNESDIQRLQQSINQKQSEKQIAEAELAEIDKNLTRVINRIADVSRQVDQLERQKQPLAGEKQRLTQQITSLQNKIDALNSEKSQVEQNITRAESAIQQSQQKLTQLNDEIQRNNQQVSQLTQQIQTVGQKISEIDSRLQEVFDRITKLNENLKNQVEARNRRLGNLAKHSTQCVNIYNRVGLPGLPDIPPPRFLDGVDVISESNIVRIPDIDVTLRDPVEDPTEIDIDLQNRCAAIEGLIVQAIERISNTPSPDQKLLEKLNTALPKIQELSVKSNDEIVLITDINLKIADLNERIEKNKTQVDELQGRIVELSKQKQEAEQKMNSLQARNNQITSEVNQLNQRIADLQAKIPEMRSRLEQIARDITSNMNQINQGQSRMGQIDQELATIDEQLQPLQQEIATLNQRKTNLDNQRNQQNNLVTRLVQDINGLNNQVAIKRSQIDQFNRDINRLNQDIANLTSRNNEISRLLVNIDNELFQFHQQQSNLQNDIAQLESRQNALQIEFNQLVQERENIRTTIANHYNTYIKPVEDNYQSQVNYLSQLNQQKSNLEFQYQNAANRINQLNNQIVANNNDISSLEVRILDNSEEAAKITNNLTQQLEPLISSVETQVLQMSVRLTDLQNGKEAALRSYRTILANFNKAKQEALTEAMNRSVPLGEKEAKTRASQDGGSAGKQAGVDHGTVKGELSAKNSAYKKGYAFGIKDGNIQGRDEGTAAGIAQSEVLAETEAYFKGAEDGYLKAFRPALDAVKITSLDPIGNSEVEDAETLAEALARATIMERSLASVEDEVIEEFLQVPAEVQLIRDASGSVVRLPELPDPSKDFYPIPNLQPDTRVEVREPNYAFLDDSYQAGHPEIVAAFKKAAKEYYAQGYNEAYASDYAAAYMQVYQNAYDNAFETGVKLPQPDSEKLGKDMAFETYYQSAYDLFFISGVESSDFEKLYQQHYRDGLEAGEKLAKEDAYYSAFYKELLKNKSLPYPKAVLAVFTSIYKETRQKLLDDQKQKFTKYLQANLLHNTTVTFESINLPGQKLSVGRPADVGIDLRNLSKKSLSGMSLVYKVSSSPAVKPQTSVSMDIESLPGEAQYKFTKVPLGVLRSETNRVSVKLIDDSDKSVLAEDEFIVKAENSNIGTSCSTNSFATCQGVDNATGRYKICRAKGQRETLCDLCVDGKQAYKDYAPNNRGFYHDYAKGCDLDPEIPLKLLDEDNIKYKKPQPKPEPKCSSAGYATCKGKDSQSGRYKVCRAKTQTLTLCNVCVDGKRAYKSVPVDNRGYYHDYASQCDSDPEIPASLTKQSNLKL